MQMRRGRTDLPHATIPSLAKSNVSAATARARPMACGVQVMSRTYGGLTMANVAMVVGPEFEDSEFRVPYDRLTQANHQVTVIGTAKGETVHGKKGRESTKIDAAAKGQSPRDYDALVIPGGHSPD